MKEGGRRLRDVTMETEVRERETERQRFENATLKPKNRARNGKEMDFHGDPPKAT